MRKSIMKFRGIVTIAVLASTSLTALGQSPSADALIHKLVEKGILTDKEAKELIIEADQTNLVSASKWKISDAIKSIGLYGDLRFRYEFRGAENPGPLSGVPQNMYQRDRKST